jgi:hypothetical protein
MDFQARLPETRIFFKDKFASYPVNLRRATYFDNRRLSDEILLGFLC